MSLFNRDNMSIGFHSCPPQCIIRSDSDLSNVAIAVTLIKSDTPQSAELSHGSYVQIIAAAPQWAGSEWLCFSSVSSSPSLACHWRSVPQTCASSCCATLLKRRCCTCSPRCVQLDDSLDQSPSVEERRRLLSSLLLLFLF